MKQKDIGLIAVIIIISGAFSLILSNVLFASPKSRQQQVEIVSPITADFPSPDAQYFNSNSLNPTKVITIGPGNNNDPFRGSGAR
jgi:hypothetical protein